MHGHRILIRMFDGMKVTAWYFSIGDEFALHDSIISNPIVVCGVVV